jgi:hypothetical protein
MSTACVRVCHVLQVVKALPGSLSSRLGLVHLAVGVHQQVVALEVQQQVAVGLEGLVGPSSPLVRAPLVARLQLPLLPVLPVRVPCGSPGAE